ncbi:hypothetical protein AB205_0008570 [Aquarana catesbeiana]|uniref:C3H1-type domain-containing protein n=1 Tax=Aquarana catesbeiana TaxID=8400 RepID=A0A2G9SJ47_AQUCT|nr:hypothetical protein AB205_0008570 [Aquarana catesbeiana]
MEDLESMLASIRSAAIAKGPQWLRAQLSGLLPGLEPVTATPAPEPAHAGRSQPPVRSNPEPPPRGCRRPGSPILDPSASPAKRTPALWSGGAGRNPLDRRTPGGERGSSPSSQTTSADQRDLAAYTAGVLPAAGVAWPGRASSTGADPMPGADETASGGSSGTTGGGAGVATPELDQRTASAKQTAQRKRRAVASDFFSQPPWEKDGSEGELTTSKEGAVDTKNFFSRLPLEKDRSEGELTTLEEGAMDASDVFSQMPGLPSEEDGSEGEQATLEEGAADTKDFFSRLPWEKDRSEDELTTLEEGAMDASDVFSQMPGLPSEEDSPEGEQATLEEGAVDAEDDPLPGSNTGLQGSGSAAVLSGVAGKPATSSPSARKPKGLCWLFNEEICKFGESCRFRHECSSCGGSHPLTKCCKQGKATSSPSARKLKGLCWLFNKETCTFGESCRFRHKCSGCGGSHPLTKCFNRGKELAKGMTPMKVEKLAPFPSRYPNWVTACLLLIQGFSEGFSILCALSSIPPVTTNLRSARLHPSVVSAKLSKEVALGRMAGPFTSSPMDNLVVRSKTGSECLVWILGHSYVFLGAEQAALKPEGQQLGFPRGQVRIKWIGVPGMLWSRVLREVEHYCRLDRPPDVLLLHVGGNDLGIRASRELSRDIKFDFLRLRSMFPNTIIVWSEMMARTSWSMAMSVERLNKARIKVNKEVGKFFVRNGGLTIRHRDLEKEPQLFLKEDGVHLNAVGIDIWSLGLQEGIQRALRVWPAAQV